MLGSSSTKRSSLPPSLFVAILFETPPRSWFSKAMREANPDAVTQRIRTRVALKTGIDRCFREPSIQGRRAHDCITGDGSSGARLMFRRGNPPCFFAFDLLTCEGKDLRTERLLDRKQELRRLLAKTSPPFPLRYAEHVERSGTALFERVCELDLEGIVAKQKSGPYVTEREHSTWFKILNREYSQKDVREELFKRERHQEPVAGWHSCDLACASLEGVASMPERR